MYGAIGGGLPPGVTEADISGPDLTTTCEQCGSTIDLDDAVWVSYTEYAFCDQRCLEEWICEHSDVVARWISE